MSDNLNKTRPQDAARINVHEEHEVTYWTKTLGISKEELIQVVAKAGTSVKAVREALEKK
ncbi:DUF3606 domain-containing protein [Ferruginibacter sp.]|uniref:DUF3606 domain-containing protein n=1 Tax=Ferruginibacter sp. TaxID=1940288 RepID=UPI00265A1E08|nr:DUF3606 domain-containing protein [Ferruginibacter sp.]